MHCRVVTGGVLRNNKGVNLPDTTALVQSYTGWLANDSTIPKLWVRAVPGALLSDSFQNADLIEYVRGFDNQEEVAVFGSHYVQEVSPHAIGRARLKCIILDVLFYVLVELQFTTILSR